MKKILFLSALLSAFCLASCEQADEPKDMAIELARPENITVKTELATATVTWRAVDKAAGYAYVLDQTVNEENPDLSVFTEIPAEPASLYLEGLSAGEHKITMLSLGDDDHTVNSLMRSATFTIDPTLPTPTPAFAEDEDTPGKVTVSWTEIKHASGYAYRFNGAAEWTSVEADVLSVTETLQTNATHTFEVKALGDGKMAVDSETASLEIKLVDTSSGAWLLFTNGEKIYFEPGDVYTYTIQGQKTNEFCLSLDNVKYGFMTKSGNGGVGTVNNANAVTKEDYFIHESVGLMAAETEESPYNPFWINLDETCDVVVTLDMTSSERPVYRMEMIGFEDPSVILAQRFDLMTQGAYWETGKGGVYNGKNKLDPGNSFDGLEVASTTCGNTQWGYQITDTSNGAANVYLSNRGLEGWTMKTVYEFAQCVRLSDSNLGFGFMTSPKLGTSGNIVVTYKALQFGSATNNVAFKVLNAGKIVSAKVNISSAEAATDIVPSDDSTIRMTNVHCPKWGNGDAKKWSVFTVTIEGVTADTQLSWDADGSANGRLVIDDIVVKKN